MVFYLIFILLNVFLKWIHHMKMTFFLLSRNLSVKRILTQSLDWVIILENQKVMINKAVYAWCWADIIPACVSLWMPTGSSMSDRLSLFLRTLMEGLMAWCSAYHCPWVLPASFYVCEYKRLGGNTCPIPSAQHVTTGFERESI